MELLHLASNTKNVHCPFNHAHVMPNKTLVLHLIKCPDRPPNTQTCGFNVTHVLLENEDLEDHERNCPDKIQLDAEIYSPANVVRPEIVIEKQPTVNLNDESWDVPEPPTNNVVKSFDQKSHVMKPMYGLTKSKRKEQRSQLHKQYPNVDLSYNENSSIQNRQDASTSGLNNVERGKEKQLFFGKKPN